MNNFRGLLGIRMDKFPNAQIRELYRVDERIEGGVLQWLGHVERMENDRIAKRVYVGKSAGSHSVGRSWKRWIDIMKNCLKKRSLDKLSKKENGA